MSNRIPTRKHGESTWHGLLLTCKKVGKDKVLKSLEEQHKVYENWHAAACAEPNPTLARKLSLICLKQDETLIRLRNMTDADIDKLLSEAKGEKT
jgi:hypothetical protein